MTRTQHDPERMAASDPGTATPNPGTAATEAGKRRRRTAWIVASVAAAAVLGAGCYVAAGLSAASARADAWRVATASADGAVTTGDRATFASNPLEDCTADEISATSRKMIDDAYALHGPEIGAM